VAAKLALRKYGSERVVIAYTDPGSEHPDNARFLADCEQWFGRPVVRLRSDQYSSAIDVWRRRKMIRLSHGGAPCTLELKKKVRLEFQRPDDIQVFGYTAEERRRADKFRELNFDIVLETPLIDAGLTKSDCLALIERAGIVLPTMYLLGYKNNNCIGCCKGGIGYWNKIRRDFPEVFAATAALQRELDDPFWDHGAPLWLDKLDPARGNHADEPNFECSLLCHMAEQDIKA
jgi:hypothetical protein